MRKREIIWLIGLCLYGLAEAVALVGCLIAVYFFICLLV